MDPQAFQRWFAGRRRHIADALLDYVAIPTVTPDESAARPFLQDYLAGVGGTTTLLPTHPDLAGHWSRSPHRLSRMDAADRGSLRARFATDAPTGAPRTMFSCHVDVVPATPEIPHAFSPRVEDDMVLGRGACDTKNNLIMLVEAMRYLREEGIAFTRVPLLDLPVEEEIGGNGQLSSILHGEPIDEAVCLEPTSLEVFRGHRGCLTFKVTIVGRAVHMGSGEAGVDAIRGAIAAMEQLRGLEARLVEQARRDPAFSAWDRPLQLNIGIIEGGEWSGSVPERCVFIGDLGFLPSSSIEEVAAMIEGACRSVDDAWVASNLTVDFTAGLRNDAYLTGADAPVVTGLAGAARAVAAGGAAGTAGGAGGVGGVGGWKVSCDGRLFAKVAGVPTVVFGSGALADAHSPHEKVSLREVAAGAAILARFLSEPVAGAR